MNCPNCQNYIIDGQMYCPRCGREIQLIPDYDPQVEGEIEETLQELAASEESSDAPMNPAKASAQLDSDTKELPDLSQLEIPEIDPKDAAAYEYVYDDAEAKEEEEAAPEEEGEFDEEYDGDFLDELQDFADEEDVVKQIALAIRESRFRWFYAALLLLLIAGVVFAVYYVSHLVYQDNSPSYQAQLAAEAAEAGDYERAISCMERSLMLDSDDVSRKYTLVDYYFANEEDGKALLLLWEIIYAGDGTAVSAYQRVIAYYEEREDYVTIEGILSECSNETVLAQYGAYLANPPEFSLPGGTYDEVVTINLSSNTNGMIYYTLDGTVPTRESEVFTAPITLDLGIHNVNAVFVNLYGIESDMVSARYIIDIRVPDAPTVYPEGGAYTQPVWITAFAQRYCTIRYTTDGTAPTIDSAEYIAPLPMPLGHSHFIFAACSQDGVLGDITEVEYDLNVEAGVEVSDILNNLSWYNLNSGRTIDDYGRLAGGTARYSYTVSAALTVPMPEQPEDAQQGQLISQPAESAQVYYLITENLIDSNEASMRTGTYYMCDVETGDLYKARRTEEMRYELLDLILPEEYAPPVIIDEVGELVQDTDMGAIEQQQLQGQTQMQTQEAQP